MKFINCKLSCIAFAISSAISPTLSYADISVTGDVNPVSPTTPSWSIPGALIVGNTTDGTLTVANGGNLTSGNVGLGQWGYIGNAAGSTGQVDITGIGSQWTNNGVLFVGYRGDGTLRILDGGVVNNPVNATHIGFDVGSTGYLEVSGVGSQLINGGELRIGGEDNSNGMMRIADGAVVTNQNDADIAYHPGSTGSVEVTGPGSIWNAGNRMFIGHEGDGSLKITHGGVVTTATMARIGAGTTSTGYVEVSGADSRWELGGLLDVATNGPGTMIISDGGVVTSQYGQLNGSVGLVEVTGTGSRWDNIDSLNIGRYTGSDGTLNISNGGTVTNSVGYVGNMAGATGRVNISGTNSTWENSGSLMVGVSGEGSVIVSDGGNLSSVGSYVGFVSGSKGDVLVTGANSNWVNSGDMRFGQYGGDTSLTINNSGTVQTNSLTLAIDATSTSVLNIGSAAGYAATSAGDINTPLITLGSGDSSIVFNHTDTHYQFNSAIDGSGKVAVYSGTTVLNGINSYSGTTTVNAGTLKAGAASSFSAASDYIVDTAGQLDLAGFSQTLNSLNNSGAVSFNGAPGAVLTVSGDYIGNDGLLNFTSALNSDTSTTDKLIVNGNTSGTTRVGVTNLGGSGAATLNGIELIEVNGLSDGEFVQQGRIVAGAYDYSLARGVGTHTSNWYLTSTAIPVLPVDPVDPVDTVTPLPMVERPEASSYSANLAAANSMFVTSLNDRMGETQYTDALTGERKVTSLWLRNSGGHNRSRDANGQLNTQANRYVLQLGGDIAQWSSNTTDRLHLGIMAGYGNSKSTTVSQVTGYNAKGSTEGYSTGVYGTWYANEADKSGLYVDSWAQYSWFNNTVNGQELANEEYKSKGVTASVESGYTFKLGEDAAKNAQYFIQPKAQVTWMGVKADDHKEANGTNVSGEGDGNIQTRLGVKAFMSGYADQDKGKDRVFQPFIEANWVHNTKDFGTHMDNVTVKQDGAANIAELKVGVEGQMNKKVNLWGNVAQQVGNKGYSDTAVMLGVKYHF
ncbi:autotransporter outer membrane beta-barrel domain-containing protein [Yersinia mollaretii]|uniref:autotransporter outer membrane beta-barrel domain-containing protein n=1 Tax=Yersinia mollaretii TaxID=33060 RepID=UPI0005E05160|nr:autotransporter outer membrane beta-barrel domain-containing protein [Yersinia mollaretii]MDA5526038.1 autotransporter outer membrane beta-barrel domain-containing protein [Yersinia mollaretii]MDR7872139.1 autotransporter outer membrane beta-barrel domain-containing protein [Yersinia mollaretii]PHZ29960.1 autotransporter outer membrane beta-barrel domain-containing protein [Yersinia mollaretii]WQC73335.1 autotransporter outer membrane beta-barrel domain-containing protein [Yersinia mollareti